MSRFLRNNWWKILGVVIIYYVIIYGFLMEVPKLAILNETIRNLFYHVALWFAMFILLIISMVYSIKYLKNSSVEADTKSQ
jgi:heme exporter protein C